jgi:hypothetical protein
MGDLKNMDTSKMAALIVFAALGTLIALRTGFGGIVIRVGD